EHVVDEQADVGTPAGHDQCAATTPGAPDRRAEQTSGVDDRQHVTSPIRHADDLRRRRGHRRQLVAHHDHAHPPHTEGEWLRADGEDARAKADEGLERRRGDDGVAHRTNRRIAESSWSALKGLVRYSSAPWRRPQARSDSWSLDETTTTRVCFVRS